jgi:LmbE family N-acetylglucosaminyl deacetylase
VFGANGKREAEAIDSAERFLQGVEEKNVMIRNFRDGFFPFHGLEIKELFESIKREFSPDLILTHYRDDRHQDHRVISDLTWNTFRDHFILEYEIPKYDGDFGSPNLFVTLDDSLAKKKARLIVEVFESQREKHWFTEDTFLAVLRLRGMESASSGKYAEAFYARKMTMSF